jgi:hypothetical protein
MHCFFCLALLFPAVLRATAEEGAREAQIPVEVKVEGAVLGYVPREIPRAKRTPRGEIELIEEASAILRVKRPLGFRRVSLEPGEYVLRVESDDQRGHTLVLEARDEPEEKKEKGARAEKESGLKGVEKTAFRGEGESEGESKSEQEGSKESRRKEPGPSPRADEAKPPRARVRDRKADGEKEAEATKPPPLLRVPLTLSPREKLADSVTFDLKVSSRGTKLRILIRAGTTEARASLRFGDPVAER